VWKEGNPGQRLLLAGAAATCLGIFVLISTFAVAHTASSLGRQVESGVQQKSSARPAVAILSSAPTPTARIKEPPAPMPPITIDPESDQPPKSALETFLDLFIGTKPDPPDFLDSPKGVAIDPDLFAVQVWTSKSSGYYYCTDTPYYKMVQPGAFMSQRDALQSGYQPKLGQFCN